MMACTLDYSARMNTSSARFMSIFNSVIFKQHSTAAAPPTPKTGLTSFTGGSLTKYLDVDQDGHEPGAAQ